MPETPIPSRPVILGQHVNLTPPSSVHVGDKEALELLVNNIGALPHPHGTINHPYFNSRIAGPNRGQVDAMKRKFCEAIVLLLESGGHLKKRPGRPRKNAE